MKAIETKLDTYPPALRTRLGELADLIDATAKQSPTIGNLEMSLKWNQFSFATKPKTGTPIRIDGDSDQGTYSVYVPCSTNLISTFRDLHPDMFEYHGDREIRFSLTAPLPREDLGLFVHAALTYYLE